MKFSHEGILDQTVLGNQISTANLKKVPKCMHIHVVPVVDGQRYASDKVLFHIVGIVFFFASKERNFIS